jgi:nitrogen fixation protein NifX
MTQFQQAYALLKGQGLQPVVVPGPVIESGVFCELSGSLRVACASGSGERIDGHFGNCPRFLIYQVAPDYIRLIDVREPAAVASRRGESDGNQQRASLIRDCTVLYTLSIGGPAVAKAVRAGLHPVKLTEPLPARNALLQLQAVLARDNPPPWLVRAMGAQPRPRPMSAD